MGNSGFIPPTKEFLEGLREITAKVRWAGSCAGWLLWWCLQAVLMQPWLCSGTVCVWQGLQVGWCLWPALCPTHAAHPATGCPCAQEGAVLCFDEVMTGFRIAKGCAQEYFGVTPDLTTMGKVCG